MNIIDKYVITKENIKAGDIIRIIGFEDEEIKEAYNRDNIYKGSIAEVLSISDNECKYCSRYNKCYHKLYIRCISRHREYIKSADTVSCYLILRKANKVEVKE